MQEGAWRGGLQEERTFNVSGRKKQTRGLLGDWWRWHTRVREDDDGARKETSHAHASHGATDDEGNRRGSDGADETAHFKYEDGREKGPFDVEVPVDDAVNGLQTC